MENPIILQRDVAVAIATETMPIYRRKIAMVR